MESIQVTAKLGARFYNLPDKKIWIEEKRLVKTDRQEVSVTTVLNPVWPKGERFYAWLASRLNLEEAYLERDEGGRRGTRIHDANENLLYGDKYGFEAYADEHFNGDLELAVPEWKRIEAFEDFMIDYGTPTVVMRRHGVPAIECELYSWEHGFGGTTDIVFTGGKFGGQRIMIDYKTSKSIYDHFWAQLAAYFVAWHEMEEEQLNGIAIWRPYLYKGEAKYQFEIITSKKEIQEWFLDFLAARRLWVRHREAEKLSLNERKVHFVRPFISIGKIAERPEKTQEAWEAPKKTSVPADQDNETDHQEEIPATLSEIDVL